MAIFRCNKCGHIREVNISYIGNSGKCPKCKDSIKIYDTVAFVSSLVKLYTEQSKKLRELQRIEPINDDEKEIFIEDIDIYNTNIFSKPTSYMPIVSWFKNRNIKVKINPDAVDTTGFFDEIAVLIGDDFDVLKIVINQIKYIQSKKYTNVKIDLSKKNKVESEKIISFCKLLYEYSFIAIFSFNKKEKFIYLNLQEASKIYEFFNGIWMEWFVLIKLMELAQVNKTPFSLSRNLIVKFSDGVSNELDLFLLTEKKVPIYIECKSGEFRQDINKYLLLRKNLKIKKEEFVLCVFGLSDAQTKGMSMMYDITFVNEKTLIEYIKSVI